jgi:transcriptional regulator GlxA family with amidase domain
MSMPRPIRVAIAAYDGVSLLDLSGPLEALRLASTHPNHLGTKLAYDCHVVSVRGGTVLTADGVGLVMQPVSTLRRASAHPRERSRVFASMRPGGYLRKRAIASRRSRGAADSATKSSCDERSRGTWESRHGCIERDLPPHEPAPVVSSSPSAIARRE